MGWAGFGQPCTRKATFIKGVRYSVLPALSLEGYVALDIFEGSVNKEWFLRFLEEQVVSHTPDAKKQLLKFLVGSDFESLS